MIEERNDALKLGYKLPIERYSFACRQLIDIYIADAGCGMGYGTYMLQSAKNRVIGIDISKEAIKYAVSQYHIAALVGNIEKMDFTGFDAVVCLEALCHLQKPLEFLKHIQTKKVIISAPIDPNPDDGYKYRLWNISESEFRGWLSKWTIIDELLQSDGGQKYLTLYGIPKNIN